jgi:hypothetical protein
MFDKYTFKQKNRVLLLIFIVLAFASYKRSFVLSIIANEEIKQQELNLSKVENSEENLQQLFYSISVLDKTIGKTNLKPDRIQQEILNTLARYSKTYNVSLESIEETHKYKNVDYSILSNEVILEGRFNNITKMIYDLELNFEFARLINVEFYKKKILSTKKTKLYAKILFQHYHQI